MGYLGNHLATVSTGIFAAVLTGLWAVWDLSPILHLIFMMAVPITWFLTFTCWISQKSNDYMHKHAPAHTVSEKKSLSNTQTIVTTTTSNISEIKQIQTELSSELNNIKESVKLKDSEIERLNQEISNLQTLVQIESLKTELANLKMLASKRK